MAAPRTAGLTHYGKMHIINAQIINSLCSSMMLCFSLMDWRILGNILTACYGDLCYLQSRAAEPLHHICSSALPWTWYRFTVIHRRQSEYEPGWPGS